jgi:hypothetical protein
VNVTHIAELLRVFAADYPCFLWQEYPYNLLPPCVVSTGPRLGFPDELVLQALGRPRQFDRVASIADLHEGSCSLESCSLPLARLQRLL